MIEDGRRSFRNRLREMTVPGRYRAPAFTELMFAKEEQLPVYARKDTLMHAPVEVRITRDGVLELDYDGTSRGATTPRTARPPRCRARCGCSSPRR